MVNLVFLSFFLSLCVYRQARDDYYRVHGEWIVGYFPEGEEGKTPVAQVHTDVRMPFKMLPYI